MNLFLESSEPLSLHALASRTESLVFKPFDGPTQEFTPDPSLAYIEFNIATAWPAGITIYGWGIHPNVLARSYASMFRKLLDYDHRREANDPKLDDRFLGHVVAVSFPSTPPNGISWRVTDKPAPYIKGVAAIDKKAQGLRRILGEHLTGRHPWTVSLDADWILEDAGYAVKLEKGQNPEMSFSPPDFIEAGWEYYPPAQAPKELKDTFSVDKNRVTKKYKGREVNVLLGGLDGTIHFCGLALVKYGAEKTAGIRKVIAAAPGNPVMTAMYELPILMNKVLAELVVKQKSEVK